MSETTEARPLGVTIHKIADKSQGERVRRFDPETGEAHLYDPNNLEAGPKPWPLAGVEFLPAAPDVFTLSTRETATGIMEGWIVGEDHEFVIRPAGAPGAKNVPTINAPAPHVFSHYTYLTFHMVDGDYRYKVVHQPDKYADYSVATHPDQVEAFEGDDTTPVTDEVYDAGATRVDWFYGLELVK